MKKLVFGILFLIVLVGSVSAVPEIQSVAGNLTQGENVTLLSTDSNFGSGEGAIPLIYDFFEQNGGDYEIGDIVNTAQGWKLDDGYPAYPAPTYDATSPRLGSTKHARSEYDGVTSTHCMFEYEHPTNLTEIFVSFWVKRNIHSWSAGGDNNKWFRINHQGYGDMSPSITFLLGSTNHISNTMTLSGEDSYQPYLPSPGFIQPMENTWTRYDFYVKESSAPGGIFNGVEDGIIKLWEQSGGEGQLFTKEIDIVTETNKIEGTKHYRRVTFGEYWRTYETTPGDGTYDWDDVYISQSQARVEIGNNQNFSLCTHREIQIPQQWADGSITFNVNQGSFSDGETAYVFVVDENGIASEGYPIIIGEQGSLSGPYIQSVSGNLSDGENVTIGGSGFGTIGPTIYKWDDFEGETHTVGNEVGAGPGNLNWTIKVNANPSIISNSYNRANSSKHTSQTFNDGTVGWSGGFYLSDGGNTLSPLFATWYFRYDVGNWNDGAADRNFKPTMPAASVLDYYNYNLAGSTFSTVQCAVWIRNHMPEDGVTKYIPCRNQNVWTRWEFYGVESSTPDAADGIIDYTIQSGENGLFVNEWHRDGDIITMTSSTEGFHWKYSVFGWYAGTLNTHLYYDDIYIADSRARVEVGNNQNFSLCTHREIQIPQSWSDGSITFNVNQGSFSDGETAYVFVVDENGNVSSGKQITFSGESNGTQPPVVYATPHVQDYITLQEMLGSIEDYKRGLTPIEQVVANIKKFIWG